MRSPSPSLSMSNNAGGSTRSASPHTPTICSPRDFHSSIHTMPSRSAPLHMNSGTPNVHAASLHINSAPSLNVTSTIFNLAHAQRTSRSASPNVPPTTQRVSRSASPHTYNTHVQSNTNSLHTPIARPTRHRSESPSSGMHQSANLQPSPLTCSQASYMTAWGSPMLRPSPLPFSSQTPSGGHTMFTPPHTHAVSQRPPLPPPSHSSQHLQHTGGLVPGCDVGGGSSWSLNSHGPNQQVCVLVRTGCVSQRDAVRSNV